ncbi:MAG: hypothetical protein WCH04_21470 [Gammaproteobacteria bacterium]
MTKAARFLITIAGMLTLVGCQSQGQILASEEGVATQTAVRRGQFELGCPQATGTILSRNMLQPVLWGGEERAEYTVGVSGCGKRSVYVVICPLGSSGCFAGAANGNPEITQ